MIGNYRKLEEFYTKEGQTIGGATGSKKVKGKDEQDYQFKPSIHDASIFRKARTGNLINPPDTELFVELIASCVSRAALKSEDGTELIPEVQLVFDPQKKDIAI